MELQQQRPCVLPAHTRLSEDSPAGAAGAQVRGVLQERSANWPQDYSIQTVPAPKLSRSPSPTENGCTQRTASAGAYFTGSVHAQPIGLAGFGAERPEKQVEYELKRLYRMLARSDKYQKYREKQPSLTVAEVLAKDAADRKRQRDAAEGRASKDEKDKTVWPEFLENAFWRALVRWPPMGRKKYMLDGALRGRNELIQDSIRKDTGVERCRKQVSSHLQVLKQHLHDQPGVLVYMGTKDHDKKRHRANDAAYGYHPSRHRPHAQRAASSSRYDYNGSNMQLWGGQDQMASPYLSGTSSSNSPFSVTHFTMFVEDNEQPVHYFTQLSANGRHNDIHIKDLVSWRRQFPEFDFLRSHTETWVEQNRRVLVCDASIKIMTEVHPTADLTIMFELHAMRDLSVFNSILCVTRFFDSGSMMPDPQFDGPDASDLKEHQTPCNYTPTPSGPGGCLRIHFGSKFWVNRMLKYQSLRHRDEACVSRSLLRLTATQTIYGIKPGGGAECITTILWRFTQTTRSSAEVGSMNWRAVTFGNPPTPVVEPKWEPCDESGSHIQNLPENHEQAMDCSMNVNGDTSLYQSATGLPLDYSSAHHTQEMFAPQQQNGHHPPPLNLDILASIQSDLDTPQTSAATSATTDYSQQSLSALSQNQDTVATYSQDANDFNFDGGHITLTGAFSPAINLSSVYNSFASQDTDLDSLQALSALDQNGYNLGLACANGNDLVDMGMHHLQPANSACYSTKPNWHHSNLVSSLENAAERYHSYDHGQAQTTHGHENVHHLRHNFPGPSPVLTQAEELVAQGLHDTQVVSNSALWNLQSPFQEDTGSGAHDSGVGLGDMKVMVDCRKDSVGQGLGPGPGMGIGLGVLDMIQREQQRAWEN